MSQKVGQVVVISAASGTGKTTLIKRLREKIPHLQFSISSTTRPPRVGEVHGKDYYFLSDSEFDELAERGQFLEWAQVHNRKYGTSRQETERLLENGTSVIFDIDVQGAQKILEATWEKIDDPEIITIFIYPPDMETLKRRLIGRPGGVDNLDVRLAAAESEMEIGRRLYAYQIVNGDGEDGIALAVEDMIGVLRQNGIT